MADEPLESLTRHAPAVVGVQVADWRAGSTSWTDRACPGEGTLPLGGQLGALEAGGFRGSYDIELFSDDGRYGRRLPGSLWLLSPAELVERATRWFRA